MQASLAGNTMWVTGGWGNGPEKLTDIIYPDGTATPGPNLKQPRHAHCQVSYENSIYIIGMYYLHCQVSFENSI